MLYFKWLDFFIKFAKGKVFGKQEITWMHLAFSLKGQSIALSTSLVTPPASINMIYNYSGLLRLKWSNCGTTRYCSEGAEWRSAQILVLHATVIRADSLSAPTQDSPILKIHVYSGCRRILYHRRMEVRAGFCHQHKFPGFRGWSVYLLELFYWCT